MEDEIDLRKYALILIKGWKIILAATVLGGAAAFAYTFVQAPLYRATALVLITAPRFSVQFEESIRTEQIDPRTATANYETLAKTGDLIASLVASPDLGEIPEAFRSPAAVGASLNPRISPSAPNVLELRAESDQPEIAATIANVWSREYVRYANDLLGQSTGSQAFFLDQTEVARARYKRSQDNLEEFVETNRIEDVTREIDLLRRLVSGTIYRPGSDRVFAAGGGLDKPVGGLDKPVTIVTIAGISYQQSLLGDLYQHLATTERLIANAEALRAQVLFGAASAPARLGNALSLALLRSQAFAGAPNEVGANSVTVQITGSQLSEPVAEADVNSLITVLKDQRSGIRTMIAEASSKPILDEEIEALVANNSLQIRALERELEAERAALRELTRARDADWDNFQALSRKASESGIAAAGAEATVRLASTASVPPGPANRLTGMTRAAGLGAALGLLAGMVATLILAIFPWKRDGATVDADAEDDHELDRPLDDRPSEDRPLEERPSDG